MMVQLSDTIVHLAYVGNTQWINGDLSIYFYIILIII